VAKIKKFQYKFSRDAIQWPSSCFIHVYRTKDGHNILLGAFQIHKHNYSAQCIEYLAYITKYNGNLDHKSDAGQFIQ
jgi:hypothetical protein